MHLEEQLGVSRHLVEEINKVKRWFFEKINTTQGEKHKFPLKGMKKRHINSLIHPNSRITRGYYDQFRPKNLAM